MPSADFSTTPPFSIQGERVLSGNEAQFEKCRYDFENFLKDHGAEPIKISYTFSDEWGFLMRVVYRKLSKDPLGDRDFPEEVPNVYTGGTWTCWSRPETKLVGVALNLPGAISDISEPKK